VKGIFRSKAYFRKQLLLKAMYSKYFLNKQSLFAVKQTGFFYNSLHNPGFVHIKVVHLRTPTLSFYNCSGFAFTRQPTAFV